MTTPSVRHTETVAAFLSEARAYLDEGNLSQASEKGWGAAVYLVEAAAEQRGWPHAWEGDLYEAVNRLAHELADKRIQRLFLAVSALHMNIYEDWMPAGFVASGLNDVEELMQRLADAID